MRESCLVDFSQRVAVTCVKCCGVCARHKTGVHDDRLARGKPYSVQKKLSFFLVNVIRADTIFGRVCYDEHGNGCESTAHFLHRHGALHDSLRSILAEQRVNKVVGQERCHNLHGHGNVHGHVDQECALSTLNRSEL